MEVRLIISFNGKRVDPEMMWWETYVSGVGETNGSRGAARHRPSIRLSSCNPAPPQQQEVGVLRETRLSLSDPN